MHATNSWKLGLFVVAGACVGVGVFALLGARYLDRETSPLHMFFNEPIDGLTVGSEVRLRGMAIGNVVEVGAAPDNYHVQVDAQIFVDTLVRLGIRERDNPTTPERFRAFIGQGMRAQLQRNALTGIAHVSIDFVDPGRYPKKDPPFVVPDMTVPTIASEFKGIIADIADTLGRIPGMVESVNKLVARIDGAVKELSLRELSAEARTLTATLREKLDVLDVAALQQDVHETLENLRDTTDNTLGPDGSVDRLAARYTVLADDVKGTLDAADVAVLSAAARRALQSIENAGGDIRESVPETRRALASLRELVELLSRDPGALLHGKTPARARGAAK